MGTRGETHAQKDIPEASVPMTGTPTEAVQGLVQAPEGVWRGEGATFGGSDNHNLMRGESRVTKRVFAVALVEDTTTLNGQGEEEPKRNLTEDRGVGVGFGPVGLLEVAKDHDA